MWSGPNSHSSTAQNPSIANASTSASGVYTLTVTNANGCTSTATTSVTVNPVVVIPTPQANTQIIFRASVTLTATGCSAVNDALKWYHTTNNVLVTIPVSPTVTSAYYAKCETTLNGITCSSAKSTDVTVTVLTPTPPIATGATISLGTSVTLTATDCSGDVGTFVLKWYQNANDALVNMPVSALVSTDYYPKCEQTFNEVIAVSAKSNVVTLTVVNRIFVDISKIAAPIQNGNSWATAYGNLQTALAAATANVEVWVAKGTYKPTTTTTRTIYFEIPTNVKVYGGFAGTENALSERNFTANVSILSGDIGTQNLAIDNSYQVVVLSGSSNNTLVDGFTITNGNANFDPKINSYPAVNSPSAPAQSGASIETGRGILVSNAGNSIIAHCSIIANTAIFGSSIFCVDGSTPTINECIISNNESTFGSAMYAQNASHFTMNNVLIVANKGVGYVYNNLSNPILTNCTIASNGGYSGAIFNSQSQPTVKNSIIWGNTDLLANTQSLITYSIVQGEVMRASVILP